MKRILWTLLMMLGLGSGIMAQTPGMIYEPATGAGKLVLDPNNDGYVSVLPTGFVADDQAESEIPFVAFVFPGFEPTSDLGPGPDCGFTDFVDEGDEDPAQYYLDAANNWLFRFRMGNTAPNAKSYSLLIDTDGKFGSTGPNRDLDYNSQNPGFEIEIVLSTKFGVFVYDVNNIPNCTPVISYPGTTNYQKAIALTTNCGDPDYFYDFFVSFNDLTAFFGIAPSTPLRIAIIDNMAANKSTLCNPNSASDLGGTDCVGPLENCFQEIIDNYPPCATNGTPCEDRTPCPVITGTYTVGNTILNGTGLAGATIEVFVDGTSAGTATVNGSGNWTLTLATGLLADQVITVSQILAPMSLSYTNCSQKTVLNCTGAPVAAPVVTSQSGKNFCGTGTVGYDIEVYYPNGTIYPANPYPSLYNPVPTGGSWVWKCTGNTGACNAGSGVDCIFEGGYMIFQTDPNGCMSYPQFVCLDPGGGYATNPGNAPVIVAASVFAGSTSVNVTVTNTTNAGDPASGFIHLFVDGAYWATSSFVSENGTFAVTCPALPACGTITASYIQSVNSINADHECFSPASTGVTISRITSAPALTGTYCTTTSITTVTGTSTEADGTQIQVFDNGAPAGAVTTVANGSWVVTGLNILPGRTITAKATSVPCGSQSAASAGIVVGTKSTNPVSITTSPIIEGTTSVTGSGTNGDVIALYIDEYQIGGTTTVAGGSWTISGLNSYDLYTNGSVTATATTPGFCAGNESVAVPVQCLLPVTTLTVNPTDTTVCSGSVVANIRVEGSESGIIYQLYNGASTSGASRLGDGGTITLTSATITANTTLTVKAIKLPLGSCTSTLADNVPVTVNAVPSTTLTVTATSPVCENTASAVQVELSQLNFNYQLKKVSDNSDVGAPVAGTGGTISLPTGVLTATTQFKVVAIGIAPSYCTGTLATQPTVTVIPGPVAPLSADVDRNNFCSDDAGNISLSVTGGSGSQVGWYTSSCGGTSIGTGNPLSIASPVITTTYYARWEDGSCYSSCQSVTATVVALPTAPTSVAATATTVCNGTSTTLSYTGGTGTTFGWYTGSCGGTLAGTGNNLSVTPAATTTYYGRWENGTCYSTCQSVTVTVTPLPTAPTSVSATATTVCNGTSTTLSYTGGTGTTFGWYTGSCGGTLAGTGNNLSVTPAATTTYYGRWENGTCYSTCQSVTVTVTPLPTAPTSVSATATTVCSGTSSTLSYTGGTGTTFGWYTGSCGGTLVGTGNNLSVSPAVTTTYYGRWENGTCYSTCQSVTITVTPLPTAPTSVSATATTVCNGTSTTLSYTGGTGTTFGWYTGSCGGTLVGTGNNLSVTPAATTTYYGRWENGTCYSTCQSVTITVTPLPTAPTSVSATATTVCNGTSTTLSYTGGTGTTFGWYTGSCGGTLVGTGNNLSVSPAVTTTYYGRWENGTCYSTCQTVTVTVTAMPTAPTSVSATSTSICNGSSTTLSYTGGSGTTFGWYSGSCGGTSVGTGNNLSVSPAVTTTYYGRWENGTCYSTCQSVTITVTPLPTAPTSVSATATTVCNGTSTTLSYTGGTGTTFGWYTGSCGGTLAGTGNNLSVTPAATTTYYGRWENGTCYSTCQTVTVTVTAMPTAPTSVSATSTSICNGSSTTLSYTGGTGTTFGWYTGSCGGTLAGTGNNLSVTPAATTTYYGRWENGTCYSTCQSVTITVTSLPTAPTSVSATATTVCNGTSTTLSYTGGTGTTFGWYTGSCGGTLAGTGNNLSVTPAATTTYYGRWENGTCYSTCQSVTITVTPLPTAPTSVSATATTVCNGTSTTLSYTGGTGTTFGWYTGSCGGTLAGTGNNLSVTPAATTTYYGRWENGTCYSTCQSVTITVNNGPSSAVISGAATICEGATTPLQVTITGGTSPYSITVNNGVGTINNYVSGTNIPVTPAATSTYLLTAVSDANGCVSSSLSGSAVVTVNFCNSSPVANDDNGGSLTEDGSNGTVSVLSNDTDPDGNPSAPTNGVGQFSVDLDPVTAGIQISFTNPAGTWTYDPVTGIVTFDPADNYYGTATMTYELCDPNAACDQAVVTFIVTPVNDPPVISDNTGTTPEDTPVTVCTSFTDVDGTGPYTVTLSCVDDGAATYVINADEVCVTYTPDLNFNGKDTVCIHLCDAGGACSDAEVVITVTPVNDPPVIDNEYISVAVNGTGSGDLTDAGDSDIDGNLVVNTTPVIGPSNGSILINADGTYTYTPDPGYTVSDQIVVEICDDGTPLPAICVNDTIFITVLPTNPPVAANDNASTSEDTSVTFNVTGNDTDSDGTINTGTVDLDPGTAGIQTSYTNTYGTWTVDASGNVTFNPAADFNGTATVIYTVNDNDGATSNTATITVIVSPVNDPPVVDNEILNTPEDTPVSGDLTDAGDYDVDGNLIVNTTPLSGPDNGTIIINADGTFTYTPSLNFNGNDTIVVEICDDGTPLPALCTNDTIFITITPVNDPPVAADTTISTPEDTPVTVCVPFTDVDGSAPYTVTLSCNDDGAASHVINPGEVCITYTPDADFNGNDTVCVHLCDAGGVCTDVEVFITVTPVNDPPVLPDNTGTTPEDTPVTVCTSFTDADGASPYTVTLSCNNDGAASYVINAGEICITYIPDDDFNGNDTVCIHLCDAGGACSDAEVVITVTPVNDPPVIDNEYISVAVNGTGSGDLTDAGDSDIDGNLVVNTTPVSGPSNGSIIINADGTYTYTPDPGYTGSDQIVVEICDDGTPLPAICVNDTIFITVLPTNPPVAANDNASTSEDTSVTFNVTGNDTDSDGTINTGTVDLDPGTAGIQSSYTNVFGTWSVDASGNVTYTPAADFNGTATVIYTVNDNDGATSNTATITVIVSPVNDPPVVDNEILNTPEDTPVSGDLTDAGDYDVDGNLIVNTTPLSGPDNGTIIINADGTFTYTPSLNFNGNDTIVVEICDDGTPLPALCTNDTIFITITPVNDPPVAADTTISTPEDTPVTVCVPFTDVDGSAPYTATLSCNDDGSASYVINAGEICITYTPDGDYNGNDTVCVHLCDAGGACTDFEMVITVTPVNDPPVTANETETVSEDSPLTGTILTPADIDPDGDNLTVITTPVAGPDNGSISMNSDGTYIYIPDPDYYGTDMLVFQICDDGTPVLCAFDTLFITVIPVNDAPVAVNDVAGTDPGVPVDVNVGINDSDEDGPTLTWTIITPPDSGIATINGSIITYTPNPGVGTSGQVIDTLWYEVCDNGTPNLCDTAMVVIYIPNTPLPPVVTNEHVTGLEDTPLVIDVTGNDYDPNGDPLTITPGSGTTPNGSWLVDVNGDIVYTPNPDFNGNDTLIVEVCDPTPNCVNDTIFIVIDPVNDAPIVTNDTATTLVNTPVSGSLIGAGETDPDGTMLLADVNPVSGPDNGTIVINTDGTYTYTPDNGFTGQDTVVVEICDNGIPQPPICVYDTLFITINSSLPPSIPDTTVVTPQDSTITFCLDITDAEGNGPYTIGNINCADMGAVGAVVNANEVCITYVPTPGVTGTDTLCITLCDAAGSCETYEPVVIIIPPNDPPVIPDTTVVTPQDSTITFCLDITDTEGDVPYTVASINCADLGNVTAVVNGTEVCITYVPTAGVTGTDTLCITLCDAAGSCETYEPVVIIIPSNDPPVIPDTTVSTPQDSTITFCLEITDTENDLPYTISNINCEDLGAVSAVITGNEICITYVPTPGVSGIDTLCVTICDAAGSCATFNPVVIITPYSNDPPVIPDTTVTTPQDSTITFCLEITDTENDLPYTISNINCEDLGAVSAVITGNEICITYVPTPGVSGIDTLCVTICDAAGSCATFNPVVIITPYSNDPPVIPDTTVTTPQDSTITFCLEITDTENDLPYTISNINCEDLGAVSAVITGNEICITYVPTPGVSGIDTLCVTICDAAGSCETYNPVVIIVPDVNTPPHVNDTTVTIQQDSTVIICMDIIDAEGNSPYSATVGCEDNGTVTWIINGNQLCVTFTPNAGFTGTDSLCVIICDAAGACDSSVIVVIVIPPVSVLIANPDFRTTKTNTPVVITILDNDVAPNSTFDLSSISVTQYPLHGSVIINSNGTATYTPDAYYTGTDIFIYNVCNNDFNPACDTAKVTIVIEPNDLTIPTGFSPDKDGVNETFVITGIEKFPNAILQIYNRWGNLVFESEIPYRNDWDGTSNVRGVAFGSDLPEATYFYLLETGTEEKPYSGYVILKRNQ